MKKIFPVLISTLIFSSCAYNRDIRIALRLAGENRAELEKVLSHYADDERKLRATKFLIKNMPGHYSYTPERIAGFRSEYERIIFSDTLSIDAKKKLLEDLSIQHNLGECIEQDVKLISGDYLIDNIDRSFEIWDNEPYCQHLTFDQFCELILPYKVVELQELDDWKVKLSEIKSLISMIPPDDAVSANTHFVAKTLCQDLNYANKVNYEHDYNGYVLFNRKTLYDVRFGVCNNYSISAIAVMRSKGIPSCYEWLPQWAHKGSGHSWHTVLNDNGVYMPSPWNMQSAPGDVFFPSDKIPKVFRYTYAANPFYAEYLKKSALKSQRFSRFQQDVTDQYIGTTDISVPIRKQDVIESYAYLAVFNNTEWSPIDVGVIRGRKAKFNNLGLGVAYIILGFNGEKLIPISEPFIVRASGKIEYMTPDISTTTNDAKFTRKYPKSRSTAQTEYYIIGGQIHAANKSDFSDADTLFIFDNLEFPDLIKTNSSKQYRYIRFSQYSPKKHFLLSELQVFAADSDEMVKEGKIIAAESDIKSPPKELYKVFDDDWLSSYSSPYWGGWVGLDLLEPKSIESIRVVPRSDDNRVRSGDTYELKYWSDGNWVSLGVQVAKDRYVIYDSIPNNALLLLDNKTRGKEERIFTYENGEVKWW